MSFYFKTIIVSLFVFCTTSLAWSDMPEIIFDPAKESSNSSSSNLSASDMIKHANQLESQAIECIDHNQMEEGLALMKQATELDPSPIRSINYGSILFGNGVVDFKNGQQQEALQVLREAEDQLSQAIAGFDPQKNAAFVAQAYFLLGEIYLNAYANPDLAHAFYYKSLEYFDNSNARTAIEELRLNHKQYNNIH